MFFQVTLIYGIRITNPQIILSFVLLFINLPKILFFFADSVSTTKICIREIPSKINKERATYLQLYSYTICPQYKKNHPLFFFRKIDNLANCSYNFYFWYTDTKTCVCSDLRKIMAGTTCPQVVFKCVYGQQCLPKKYLPSATKLRRLCFYTCLSVILFTEGEYHGRYPSEQVHPHHVHPREQVCPRAGTCPSKYNPGQVHPQGRYPLADGYCCGPYASYWNAFLFTLQEHQNILKNATISRDSDIENVLG